MRLHKSLKFKAMDYLTFLYPFFLIVHVCICLFLILLVLIQSDKGGGLAGAFGGIGGGAAFTGASAANIITKITQGTAIVSFIVILMLNALSVKKSGTREVQSDLKSSNLSSVIPQGYGAGTDAGSSQQAIPGVQQAPESNEKPSEETDTK
ncbi:preprotein translocase subunit SecG [Fibrobacterota bacterium]